MYVNVSYNHHFIMIFFKYSFIRNIFYSLACAFC